MLNSTYKKVDRKVEVTVNSFIALQGLHFYGLWQIALFNRSMCLWVICYAFYGLKGTTF